MEKTPMHQSVRARSVRVCASALAALALLFPVRSARAEFPTLDRAVQLARERSIVVAEAVGELGVANAQLRGASVSSFANPYTEVQIDRPINRGIEGTGEQSLQAMTFNYFPIDIAGQRGKRIEEAERLIDWRKLGIVNARAQATGDVVAAYGEMVINASRVNETKSGEETAREEAKYFQGRFDAKDTTLYEKSLAEAEVARWVQSRAEAELRLTGARARFGQITGATTPVEAPPNTVAIVPPPLRGTWDDTHVARVVDKAPIVSRLLAEKTYWDASIERYERERIPPVSFEVIAGRGAGYDFRLGGGAVVTFPITRRYQGEIARADSGREHALRQLGLYRGIIQSRLHAARDAISAVDKALAELDKNGIPALERAVSASVEGFKAGKIDLTRALLARRDLAIARSRRLDIIEASWRAYADLVILTGDLP